MPIEWIPVPIKDEGSEDEPLGSKPKFWVVDPADGHHWLFKYARSRDGEVRGEDWAEWTVHHIATLIGIPTAEIRPAYCREQRGIVSRSVISLHTGQRLVHGNSLLSESNPFYQTGLGRGNVDYTVEAVCRSLAGVAAPLVDPQLSDLSGFDVWAGYVVLDALVAGRDRHHENWGVISERGRRSLSPSFDHGNALGFQEHDDRRQRCLDDATQMIAWAARGRSHHFAGKPSLVAVAHDALTRASPAARQYWKAKIENLDLDQVQAIVAHVPADLMSEAARRFTVQLVEVNKRRLLDGYPRA